MEVCGCGSNSCDQGGGTARSRSPGRDDPEEPDLNQINRNMNVIDRLKNLNTSDIKERLGLDKAKEKIKKTIEDLKNYEFKHDASISLSPEVMLIIVGIVVLVFIYLFTRKKKSGKKNK